MNGSLVFLDTELERKGKSRKRHINQQARFLKKTAEWGSFSERNTVIVFKPLLRKNWGLKKCHLHYFSTLGVQKIQIKDWS